MPQRDLPPSHLPHDAPGEPTIIVTGGCGFIGSNLIRHLLSSTSFHVVNIDKLTYAGNPHSLADISTDRRYTFYQLDITDFSAIRETLAVHRPIALMHLAAESHVDRSIDAPAAFIQTNVIGTFQLLTAATEYVASSECRSADEFRFVHVSTDEVYGALGETGRFSETTAYNPHSPYSASKASSDHLARAWHSTYDLPVIVTNCSNNYGPYQFPEKLIPLMIIRALSEQPLPVYGRGENVRDWLHVSDHAKALTTVLEKGTVGETYNIGGNCERRNIDLVRSICTIMDQLSPRSEGSYADLITFVEDRPGHDYRYAIDSSKICDELHWHPGHDLESGLRQTVQWYLSNPSWWQAILDGNYQLQRLGTTHPTNDS